MDMDVLKNAFGAVIPIYEVYKYIENYMGSYPNVKKYSGHVRVQIKPKN